MVEALVYQASYLVIDESHTCPLTKRACSDSSARGMYANLPILRPSGNDLGIERRRLKKKETSDQMKGKRE